MARKAFQIRGFFTGFLLIYGSFFCEADGLDRANISSFLAVAGVAFVGADHPGFVIPEFKDLRANLHARSTADTGIPVDFRLFHLFSLFRSDFPMVISRPFAVSLIIAIPPQTGAL
jgi:hypothetical protein